MATSAARIATIILCLTVAIIVAVVAVRGRTVGLFDIERGRGTLIDAAERFRDRAGPAYQQEALAAVRRSCPYMRVLRLDETPPSAAAAGEASVNASAAMTLFEADFSRGAAGFEPVDEDARFQAAQGALALHAGQLRTAAALAIPKEQIGTIEIEASTAAPAHLLVGWSDEEDAMRLVRDKSRIDLIADGRFHTYSIDAAKALERGLEAGAVVRRLFVSARADGTTPVYLRRVRVHSWKHRYPSSGYGVTYEKLGGELRRALFQVPAHTLRYDIVLPAQAPVFEAGLGVLGTDGSTEFAMTLLEGDRSYDLLKQIDSGVGWDDVRVDLSRWAGRSVSVQLSARTEADSIALWSSPVIRSDGEDGQAPPSVVMIVEDALRPDRLALYGGPVASPGHDRIAARGVVFERAFAQAPQTRSSVPSLMTSLLPSATGTWDFSDFLRDEYVTLAEVLRACGYQTASFIQNGNAGAYAGLHQGFDVLVDEEQAGTSAHAVLELARQWIEAQQRRPYFAYVHVLDPHGPFDPELRPELPQAEGELLLEIDRFIDPPWLERPTASVRRSLYDAEVAGTDAALASFVAWMEHHGHLDTSILAVLADHGEYLGEHGGMWRHHPPGHLEVTRVPLLLSGPGVQSHRRVQTPVPLLDVMPTLLELTGIDASALAMHGASLLSLKSGRTARVFVSEEPELERGGRSARDCGSVFTGGLQIMLACLSDQAWFTAKTIAGAEELPRPPVRFFDTAESYGTEIGTDPVTQRLLQMRTGSLLKTLQTINIEAWQKMTRASAPAIPSAPAHMERLRALGYAQ
ncbi:MAG TPA: sulfatase [Candidatus Limnocylindrales bacterium]|nr:sulfatase [Candidatus Limnocylindrales bacterium]